MYDQSLEQLIDAVIADGVITDQERKVVYKKAASLGIDQDEIEVYLEGRLENANNSKTPKTNKVGTMRTCPNCGANIGSFAAICPECGHEISGVEGNSSVHKLQKQLTEVGKLSDNWGSVKSALMSDKIDSKKAEIIENFPIPNTKDDFIEFATLCMTKLQAGALASGIEEEAWRKKSKQIIEKAKILFKNDADVAKIVSELEVDGRKAGKNRKKQLLIGLSGIFIPIIILSLLAVVFDEDEEGYANDLIEQIDMLPTPTAENYLDCYRKFHKIQWTKDTDYKWEEPYNAYNESRGAYSELLLSAYRKAGVPENEIPRDLLETPQNTKAEELTTDSIAPLEQQNSQSEDSIDQE